MAKFWVGRAGGSDNSGAGWIGRVYFASPQEYETDDPAMIELLQRSGVARLIEPEPTLDLILESPPIGYTKEELVNMKNVQLRQICESLGLPSMRANADMIEAILAKQEGDTNA